MDTGNEDRETKEKRMSANIKFKDDDTAGKHDENFSEGEEQFFDSEEREYYGKEMEESRL